MQSFNLGVRSHHSLFTLISFFSIIRRVRFFFVSSLSVARYACVFFGFLGQLENTNQLIMARYAVCHGHPSASPVKSARHVAEKKREKLKIMIKDFGKLTVIQEWLSIDRMGNFKYINVLNDHLMRSFRHFCFIYPHLVRFIGNKATFHQHQLYVHNFHFNLI